MHTSTLTPCARRRRLHAQRLSARLDEATLKALDRLTEKTNRSRNWLVARAVEDLVALNAWRLDKIETGLVAANRGEFAHDEELARVRKKFGFCRKF